MRTLRPGSRIGNGRIAIEVAAAVVLADLMLLEQRIPRRLES